MAEAKVNTATASIEDVDITLKEHQETAPLDLSESALRVLSTKVNNEQPRLKTIEKRDGRVRLKATEHVGIVSLPGGPTIEIRPKAPETNLLTLLRYAYGIKAATVEEPTSLTAGRAFIEALATLFKTELDTALNLGLHRDYRRVSETVSHLRGQLDVQRQLQRQGPTPTEFECTYDTLTVDTLINRAVLYATTVLTRLVRDQSLSQALDRHQQQLRQQVTLTRIRPVDIEDVELTRLSAHYANLLRLTELVLRNIYIEELRRGNRASFSLLVNMNDVFEAAVERAVREAVAERSGWSVEGQASSQTLVTGGKRTITIRPDVLVRDSNGTPMLVGDMKWKLDDLDDDNREPSNQDIYQLVSYQLAHDVPGMLFYPEQKNRITSQYSVSNLHLLHLVEVPVSRSESKEETFSEEIRDTVSSALAATEVFS